jgi:hypothetical protein
MRFCTKTVSTGSQPKKRRIVPIAAARDVVPWFDTNASVKPSVSPYHCCFGTSGSGQPRAEASEHHPVRAV